jgi:hypothetical protein
LVEKNMLRAASDGYSGLIIKNNNWHRIGTYKQFARMWDKMPLHLSSNEWLALLQAVFVDVNVKLYRCYADDTNPRSFCCNIHDDKPPAEPPIHFILISWAPDVAPDVLISAP